MAIFKSSTSKPIAATSVDTKMHVLLVVYKVKKILKS